MNGFRRERPKVVALDVAGRAPPSDHATESVLVAAAFHDPRGRAELLAALPAEEIDQGALRTLWSAMGALESVGRPVDLFTLCAELAPVLGDLGDATASGVPFLQSVIAHGAASRRHAFEWAAHLRRLAQQRRIINACAMVTGEAFSLEPQQAATFPARALEQVATACVDASPTGGPQAIGELSARRRSELGEQWDGKRDPWGMSLPFKRLHAKLHGFRRGEVVIIGGDTGSGKSVLAQQIGLHLAGRTYLGERVAVGVIGLEMPRDDYWDRAVCSLTEDAMGRAGAITEADLQQGPRASDGSLDVDRCSWVDAAVRKLEGLPFYIEDGGHDMARVRSTVRRFQALARRANTRLGMVILDHMHLLRYERAERRDIAISDATEQMKRIAIDDGVAFVALGQFKREASEREPAMLPRTTDLKEGSAIEQIADKMILLHRPWVLHRDKSSTAAKDCKNEIRAVIAKNRKGGGLGSVSMHFGGEYRFDEDERGE